MLAPALVRRSLPALIPSGMGSKVFAHQAPGRVAKNLPDASHGLGLPSRVRPTPSRRSNARTASADAPEQALGRPENRTPKAAPPLRFIPLQRIPERGSGLRGRVCLTRPPAPSGFRNLLTPCSAPNLLALFHARSARGVRPSELSSSRAAVCRFQHRCPLGVGSARGAPRPRPDEVAAT
jgi:hypothetical protein